MDHEDNGPIVIGVTWMLSGLSAGFLGLRVYAKLSRRQGLWLDDYILILSWLLLLVNSILLQYCRSLGMGRHVWTIPINTAFELARLTYIGASISCFAATFSKISFGVTLLRLTKGPLRAFVWFCIVSLFILMLPSAFLAWIQCRPVAKLYNPFLKGTCFDHKIVRNYGFFNAAFCATVDFALALAPWKVLWGLQLKTREKIGVGVAMSMGLLAGVCAIIKGVYLQQVTDLDFFYKGKDVTIWTHVETATAIIGASIPVLRVFFKDTISSLQDRYHRATDKSESIYLDPVRPRPIHSASSTQTPLIGSQARSMIGAGELGTVIVNQERVIVQTNTVTVEHGQLEKEISVKIR